MNETILNLGFEIQEKIKRKENCSQTLLKMKNIIGSSKSFGGNLNIWADKYFDYDEIRKYGNIYGVHFTSDEDSALVLSLIDKILEENEKQIESLKEQFSNL